MPPKTNTLIILILIYSGLCHSLKTKIIVNDLTTFAANNHKQLKTIQTTLNSIKMKDYMPIQSILHDGRYVFEPPPFSLRPKLVDAYKKCYAYPGGQFFQIGSQSDIEFLERLYKKEKIYQIFKPFRVAGEQIVYTDNLPLYSESRSINGILTALTQPTESTLTWTPKAPTMINEKCAIYDVPTHKVEIVRCAEPPKVKVLCEVHQSSFSDSLRRVVQQRTKIVNILTKFMPPDQPSADSQAEASNTTPGPGSIQPPTFDTLFLGTAPRPGAECYPSGESHDSLAQIFGLSALGKLEKPSDLEEVVKTLDYLLPTLCQVEKLLNPTTARHTLQSMLGGPINVNKDGDSTLICVEDTAQSLAVVQQQLEALNPLTDQMPSMVTKTDHITSRIEALVKEMATEREAQKAITERLTPLEDNVRQRNSANQAHLVTAVRNLQDSHDQLLRTLGLTETPQDVVTHQNFRTRLAQLSIQELPLPTLETQVQNVEERLNQLGAFTNKMEELLALPGIISDALETLNKRPETEEQAPESTSTEANPTTTPTPQESTPSSAAATEITTALRKIQNYMDMMAHSKAMYAAQVETMLKENVHRLVAEPQFQQEARELLINLSTDPNFKDRLRTLTGEILHHPDIVTYLKSLALQTHATNTFSQRVKRIMQENLNDLTTVFDNIGIPEVQMITLVLSITSMALSILHSLIPLCGWACRKRTKYLRLRNTSPPPSESEEPPAKTARLAANQNTLSKESPKVEANDTGRAQNILHTLTCNLFRKSTPDNLEKKESNEVPPTAPPPYQTESESPSRGGVHFSSRDSIHELPPTEEASLRSNSSEETLPNEEYERQVPVNPLTVYELDSAPAPDSIRLLKFKSQPTKNWGFDPHYNRKARGKGRQKMNRAPLASQACSSTGFNIEMRPLSTNHVLKPTPNKHVPQANRLLSSALHPEAND